MKDVLASRQKKNLARIDSKELPELLRKIEAYKGAVVTRLAMKLMAMTFVRTTELIGARWSEFDLDSGRWDIPAERMKMKTPHIVPLSKQTVSVLRILHVVTGHGKLLFPGERDHRDRRIGRRLATCRRFPSGAPQRYCSSEGLDMTKPKNKPPIFAPCAGCGRELKIAEYRSSGPPADVSGDRVHEIIDPSKSSRTRALFCTCGHYTVFLDAVPKR